MTHRIVAVVWDDAHIDQGASMSADEITVTQPIEMITYGLLVREDDRLVGVAAELCGDGTYRGVTFVPRSLVTRIVPLGPWPKRERRSVKPANSTTTNTEAA
jgi:hypothetical protein